MWEENPRELFQEKPMQSSKDWKPNPQSAPGVIQTGSPKVDDEEKYHNDNPNTQIKHDSQ